MTGFAVGRSHQQRIEALERANRVRIHRARLKERIKRGDASVVDVLRRPHPLEQTMKVWELLLAQPKVGRVRVARLHRQLEISPSKTVGGLSKRQRTALLETLS